MSIANVDVTVAEVRTALNEIDATVINDSTIEQKIADAKVQVAYYADPRAPVDMLETAVRYMAARDAFLSLPPTTQESEMNVSESYDVESYIEHLNAQVDDWLELVEDPDPDPITDAGRDGGIRSDIL